MQMKKMSNPTVFHCLSLQNIFSPFFLLLFQLLYKFMRSSSYAMPTRLPQTHSRNRKFSMEKKKLDWQLKWKKKKKEDISFDICQLYMWKWCIWPLFFSCCYVPITYKLTQFFNKFIFYYMQSLLWKDDLRTQIVGDEHWGEILNVNMLFTV